MSDSSYEAVTRHRRPFSTMGRPPVLELMDDDWVSDVLEDDDLPTKRYEPPLMDDEELEGEPVVVCTGTSSTAVSHAAERRRREEGWNDLGLDHLDDTHRRDDNHPHHHHDNNSSSSNISSTNTNANPGTNGSPPTPGT